MKGRNYGWSICEGRHEYHRESGAHPPCTTPGLSLPVVEYPHGSNCSVIGGFVYRGTLQPALSGRYFFRDHCTGAIWSIPSTQRPSDPLPPPMDTPLTITSFGEDALGELYVVGWAGSIARIRAN